jgi:hypothetical protein
MQPDVLFELALAAIDPRRVSLGRLLLQGAPELEAALAAIGPPGSPAVLEALARHRHRLLREACASEQPLEAFTALLRAYGEAPDARAGLAAALDEAGAGAAVIRFCSHSSGHTAAISALLGAYRRAGRAHEALAAGDHAALHAATENGVGAPFLMLLDEYGAPGCDAVLAALASRGHGCLRFACGQGHNDKVLKILSAYGPAGCAALRAVLAADGCAILRGVIRQCGVSNAGPMDDEQYSRRTLISIARAGSIVLTYLLRALAEPDCATGLRLVNAVCAERPDLPARLPIGSLAARLAARTPAAWAAMGNGAARALLSRAERAERLLPTLLALRRLPPRVAQPAIAYLRAHQCVLYVAPQRYFGEPAAGAAGGGGA